MSETIEHPLDKASRVVGSGAELARLLGVSKSALNQWKEDGRAVPPRRCPEIERLTRNAGEVVTCEELNGAVDWAYLRQTAVVAKGKKRGAHA